MATVMAGLLRVLDGQPVTEVEIEVSHRPSAGAAQFVFNTALIRWHEQACDCDDGRWLTSACGRARLAS